MLIKALCDYYDLLAANGKVLPEGYSRVNIHYLVCLTPQGEIGDILNYQRTEITQTKKGEKERLVPRELVMPWRSQKPGIDSNIAEHRPLFLFGLNEKNGVLSPDDSTDKAKKSHSHFKEKSGAFFEDLHSPVIDAYKAFIENWNPENETENRFILDLGKSYGTAGFAFCLDGSPDLLLHEDRALKAKWDKFRTESAAEDKSAPFAQCGITGEVLPISDTHNKIKGVPGGLATGCTLVSYKNDSEQSYGNKQSQNSNISKAAMEKYTEALNYLMNGRQHKMLLDDLILVFWAMNADGVYEDTFVTLLSGGSEKTNSEQTEQMLSGMLKRGRGGVLATSQLKDIGCVDDNVTFYMAGIKPNAGRLSLKFIYKRKFGDILWNIAKFQQEIQVSEKLRPVPLYFIKKELISPKSTSDKINPAIMTKLFESIIYATPFPVALMETVIRRVRTDSGEGKINSTRAGIIKACLNRNYEGNELTVALDLENHGQAYLCGRLFAVLEKLQQDAASSQLNRTIKDAYFASASSTPAVVFPKLIKLAQNHLKKSHSQVFYNKLIQEITDNLEGKFPDMLPLREQGEFIIGYYHQYQNFFKKKVAEEAE